MYLIAKQFSFSASHRLDGLESGHPCSRDHGHNYTVRVALAADELDGTGFVADFHRLDPLKRYIAETLDHRSLNEVLPFQPSCECLARHLFEWCSGNLEPVGEHLRRPVDLVSEVGWGDRRPSGAGVVGLSVIYQVTRRCKLRL